MALPKDDQQNEEQHTWPSSLLLNQGYAHTFSCMKCKGIPMKCMNDADGNILCEKCAQNMDNVSPIKAVQNIVDNLKTKCLSLKDSQRNDDNEENEGNVVDTQQKEECDWTATIKEWKQHREECAFLVIYCKECKVFQSPRKLLPKHMEQCPGATIFCPLSCGVSILRKNKKNHVANDCAEKLLNCSNDDCKMQVKRKDFAKHLQHECDVRIVQCEFVKYGCSATEIKACELKQHMAQYKIEHLSNRLDYVTNQLHEKDKALATLNAALQMKINETMPIGSIVMWSGDANKIPKCWALCDGTHATPDLRNRFVIGASDDIKMNSKGGTMKHSHDIIVQGHQLTVDEMPRHSHDMACKPWVRDSGSVFYVGHGRTGNKNSDEPTSYSDSDAMNKYTGGNRKHSHDATSRIKKHMPPYYALCFIMKCA